jgi:hypothetical protein
MFEADGDAGSEVNSSFLVWQMLLYCRNQVRIVLTAMEDSTGHALQRVLPHALGAYIVSYDGLIQC